MNYQKVKLKGKRKEVVFLDIDAKRTTCKYCKRLINFGMKNNGKILPIEYIINKWYFHYEKCKEKNTSNSAVDKVIEIEKNQEYINSL